MAVMPLLLSQSPAFMAENEDIPNGRQKKKAFKSTKNAFFSSNICF